jgi:lipoprotein-anchoring transpeptidase ErfK/SrfK
MSSIYKVVRSIVLIAIAIVFLYFSYSPSELQKYTDQFNEYIDNIALVKQLREINLFPVSERELNSINSRSIYVNYPQKSVRVSLSDIGVSIDNRKNQVLDRKKFESFKDKLDKEFQYLKNAPNINLETNEFYALGGSSNITLDEKDFLTKINYQTLTAVAEPRVYPKFLEVFIETENQKANLQLKNQIISTPLTIKAGRMEVKVSQATLDSFIEKISADRKEVLKINTSKIENYLIREDGARKFPTEINFKAAGTKLSNYLLFRLTEENSSKTFILPINGSFSFSTSLHPKYIEVNKSQQRAYLFENGELKKTLLISTGVTWETPLGSFKILNKVPMTISYTNNWYMPWYLPIGTINGPYYFGFHEVPYHMDYNGVIYSRDPETIGSPATGGCIQVLKGQAKELFDWAEVGMPVYITE